MTDVWQQGEKLFCRAVFQGTRYWQSKSKQAWVILHFDQAHLPLKQQQKNTFVHFPVPNYDKHFWSLSVSNPSQTGVKWFRWLASCSPCWKSSTSGHQHKLCLCGMLIFLFAGPSKGSRNAGKPATQSQFCLRTECWSISYTRTIPALTSINPQQQLDMYARSKNTLIVL